MNIGEYKLLQDESDKSFPNSILDGIVDFEQYSLASPKILWILKEANSDDIDWTAREALMDLKHESGRGLKSGWANTFTPIVYSTNALFTGEDWDNMGNFNENQTIIDVLQKVAFINVKKQPGGSLANWNLIKEYYNENKPALHKQVKTINPEVIIFGGTYNFFDDDFFEIFGNLESDVSNHSLHIHQNEKYLLLNAYHPNNRAISQKEYCNLILEAYHNWKQKYNK